MKNGDVITMTIDDMITKVQSFCNDFKLSDEDLKQDLYLAVLEIPAKDRTETIVLNVLFDSTSEYFIKQKLKQDIEILIDLRECPGILPIHTKVPVNSKIIENVCPKKSSATIPGYIQLIFEDN